MSSPPTAVHPYAYRAPRVDCGLPVEFITEGRVLSGCIRNLSEKGLLADFLVPLQAGTYGAVRFRLGRSHLELEAHVIHTEAFTAGIDFAFASEQERAFISALMQVLIKSRSLDHAAG